jgi:DNA-binding XRE family transcriptional regulator
MTKKELGTFVYDKRIELNLSQSQLAEKIDKRRQAVFEVEKDLVDFRVSVLIDLLAALGYKLSVVPVVSEVYAFDFSKIPVPETEPQTFTKKKKTNEKDRRRTGK